MIDGKRINFFKKIYVDENNEIYIDLTNCTIEAPTFKMSDTQRKMWTSMDNDVIKYFENDFTVKMKFIEFGSSYFKNFDSKSFKFKILG